LTLRRTLVERTRIDGGKTSDGHDELAFEAAQTNPLRRPPFGKAGRLILEVPKGFREKRGQRPVSLVMITQEAAG